jgi:hypothetical protein
MKRTVEQRSSVPNKKPRTVADVFDSFMGYPVFSVHKAPKKIKKQQAAPLQPVIVEEIKDDVNGVTMTTTALPLVSDID